MRFLIGILSLLISFQCFANTYAKMFNIVFRNDLYYASYIFIKKAAERGERVNKAKANTVIDTIHPSVFIHDYDLDEFITKKTQLDYAVAIRRFFLNDFRTAKRKLINTQKNMNGL